MKNRSSRVLAVLLTTSVILSVGVLAAPYAIRENDTIGLILFTSDRANPSTRGMCGNCEDIYVMPPEADPLGTNATRLTWGGGAATDPTAYNSGGADWSNTQQLIAFNSNRVNRTPQIS